MRTFWAAVLVVGVGCGGAEGVDEGEETQAALCSPHTCEALGVACGTVSDGCGGVLDCGECACQPKSCAQLLRFCGPAEDGCGGTVDCGPCACEVHEDLGSALGVVREGSQFPSSGVNFGLGYYHPMYAAFLWTAPHTGSFVISGGQGGVEPRVRTGHCGGDATLPGPTSEFPDRYDLQAGQQVWITFVGDFGSRWATESNFYRLSINEAASSEAGRCGNGFNDDGDGLFDCADSECLGDPACAPQTCADVSPSPGIPLDLEFTQPPPSLDRFPQPCGYPTVRHVERVVHWTAPKAGYYVFHAVGATAYAISLWSSCGGSPLACDWATSSSWEPTPVVARPLGAGESVLVVLEGTSTGTSWAGPPSRLVVDELKVEGTAEGNCGDGRDNDADGHIDGEDDACQ